MKQTIVEELQYIIVGVSQGLGLWIGLILSVLLQFPYWTPQYYFPTILHHIHTCVAVTLSLTWVSVFSLSKQEYSFYTEIHVTLSFSWSSVFQNRNTLFLFFLCEVGHAWQSSCLHRAFLLSSFIWTLCFDNSRRHLQVVNQLRNICDVRSRWPKETCSPLPHSNCW